MQCAIQPLCVCVCVCVCVCLCVCSVMTDYLQPGSSIDGIFRQEYWGGLLFPPSGDLSDPGIEPKFLMSPALVGRFFTTEPELQLLSPLF